MNQQPEALRLADALGDAPKWQQLQAAAELRRLHQFEVSANEWIKKTEWVQETATCKELGYHRADVIKQRFDRLIAQCCELLTALRYIEGLALADEFRDIPTILQTASSAIAKADGEMQ